MLFNTQMILEKLKDYKSPKVKLLKLVKEGKYLKLKRGLYEDDKKTSGYFLANAIYGPSYLSFEYALSYYELIPEKIFEYTSATCNKNRSKKFENDFGTFTYQDVPKQVYRLDILLKEEEALFYQIASAEKALCDTLYKKAPVESIKQLKQMLFEDMRIDEEQLFSLNIKTISFLAPLYHKQNLDFLKKMMEAEK